MRPPEESGILRRHPASIPIESAVFLGKTRRDQHGPRASPSDNLGLRKRSTEMSGSGQREELIPVFRATVAHSAITRKAMPEPQSVGWTFLSDQLATGQNAHRTQRSARSFSANTHSDATTRQLAGDG